MKWWLFVIVLIAASVLSVLYRRHQAINSTDYTDPLRYERMSQAGNSITYTKEPVSAWKIISGPKKLELTGGGQVLSCMDRHLLFGDLFEAPRQPDHIGDAIAYCKSTMVK